ncbi:hypothetical protein TNCV_4509901 [Trichonephila clavipes]|nr:hypothetical protein TNCV_4509901 [Trichonephila clavipes]
MITSERLSHPREIRETFWWISVTSSPPNSLDMNPQIDWTNHGDYNMPLTQCPPRLPDFTLCDLFRWGYVQDNVFASLLLVDLAELKQRITIAIDVLDSDILTRVWAEKDYMLHVGRVTKGSHIEHL